MVRARVKAHIIHIEIHPFSKLQSQDVQLFIGGRPEMALLDLLNTFKPILDNF